MPSRSLQIRLSKYLDRSFLLLLVRYGLSGASVACVYIVLVEVLVLGVPLTLANITAYVAAILFQYAAHGAYTFRRKLADLGQFIRFLTVVSAGLAFSTAVQLGGARLGYDPIWNSLFVALVLAALNFSAFMIWVFRRGGIDAGVVANASTQNVGD